MATLAQANRRLPLSFAHHGDWHIWTWIHLRGNPPPPPQRRALADSRSDIRSFIDSNSGWVIEGCYSDLIELALPDATEIVFLDLSVEDCLSNARSRPWEPHKYEAKEAQDANLDMLLEWIGHYPHRRDTFSRSAHQQLYESFSRQKRIYTNNTDR